MKTVNYIVPELSVVALAETTICDTSPFEKGIGAEGVTESNYTFNWQNVQ